MIFLTLYFYRAGQDCLPWEHDFTAAWNIFQNGITPV
nr:MAG TPA: hypothetical protein [Caudoviricetes sp.]